MFHNEQGNFKPGTAEIISKSNAGMERSHTRGWLIAQQIIDAEFYIKAILDDGIVIDSKCLKKPYDQAPNEVRKRLWKVSKQLGN